MKQVLKTTPVTVIANTKTGTLIGQSANRADWGYIQLKQTVFEQETGKPMNKRDRYAIISGEIDALKEIGYQVGQQLPGRLFILESTTPTNEKNIQQDLKLVPGTNVTMVDADGQPIYRQTLYDVSGAQPDVFIDHANKEETKAASYSVREQQLETVEIESASKL